MSNFNKQMNIYNTKIKAYLLNLAPPPIKQLKILNKIQLINIQIQIYIQTNIVVSSIWGQHTIT